MAQNANNRKMFNEVAVAKNVKPDKKLEPGILYLSLN